MFGIGMPEMLLILAIALIVIGPKKLPDLAKSLGRAFSEFKKATTELKESMEIDTELKEVKTTFEDMRSELKEAIDIDVGAETDEQGVKSAPEIEDQKEQETKNDESKGALSDG
jgi:TatA/E family protein of Tat protein translocase